GGVPSDRIAAQAYSSFEKATLVTVPRETRASARTLVRLNGPGEGKTAYGHVQVRAEQFGEATVVLDHAGSGTYADNVEFVLGDGAHLTVVSVQDWADDAVHVSEQHLKLGRDAHLKHIVVTLGGDLVRVSPTATFGGPGGDVEMLGLHFADSGQHQEHRLFVDHAVPNCKSNVLYKGALQGDDAHAVRGPRRRRRDPRPALRRLRPAPGAPAVRRPRGAELQVQRPLQGRAAGRRRARGLDRRRADPRGRRGHRDVRAQPQPGADR